MSLGDLTKQLAKQAIGDTVKGVLEGDPAQPQDLAALLLNQVQAMQKALKDEDELVVLYANGNEMIRVFEIFLPSRTVVVLSGLDPQRATTRVITPIHSLQFVCKVAKVSAGAKPVRVNIVTGKT